ISAYSPSYTFPVDSIERVEVSRGPASVLYGTNAFEGVINIVTKKGGKNGYTFSMEGGEFNTERMEFTTAYSTGDLMVNAGLMYHSTDGWPFTSASASDGTPFTKDIFQDNKGVNARIGYKDWTLSVTHGNMKQAAFLSLEDGDPLSFDSQVTVVDLGYNLLVGAWSIDFHATQNHEVFDWVIQEPVFPLYTNDWLGEVTAYGYLGNVNITLGGVVQRLRTGTNGGVVSTPYEGVNWVYSTYAQGQYNPRDNLEFTFGFQLNKPDTVDEIDFVPRLGAVWTFDTGSSMTKSGLKFLYGEAFRSPSLLERTINTPGIQLGNPDLKPESIATFDLQLFNYTANYETSLTVYRSEQTDLIALVPSDEYFIGEYRNVAKLVSEGVELEAKYMPNDNWYIQGSYSWQESEEKTGLANSSLAPNSNWKVGVGYTSPIFKGSLFNQHDGAYQEIPGANVINPASEAVDLVSLNLSMDLGGLMPLAGVNRYNVYLRGTNLLDEEIWVPDFLTRANNTVPGGPGRSVYAGLKFGF
ncbi:MAG: TonB-dependent receptor, partial [Acidobacteriota bacterium]|nr:TonB-dependent receptor [Acidobacteriota bacterium]